MTNTVSEPLCINTQKDQIIARLILQKCTMYVEYTEKWLDGFISKRELDHVMQYTHPSDCIVFHSVWEELEGYWNEGFIK
jgi:hypothetical protein